MTTDYLMGISDTEFERLKLQADYLKSVTQRLFKEAGIGPGMRVLDVGCGMGDVSMLLADAVGPSGHVVAIDREERAIGVARVRAAQAGYGQIDFVVTTDADFGQGASFDATVGRYVLFRRPDPAAMIRRAAAWVRPGGVVAFHEMVTSVDPCAVPPLELWDRVVRLGFDAARAALPYSDAGGRLFPLFEDAGLVATKVFCECVVGGSETLAIPWLVMSYNTLLPVIDRQQARCRPVSHHIVVCAATHSMQLRPPKSIGDPSRGSVIQTAIMAQSRKDATRRRLDA